MSDLKEKTSESPKHTPTGSKERVDRDLEATNLGYEKDNVVAGMGTLKRQLKNRHIAMIAIGGVCVIYNT
jgi:amino acid permease